MKQRSTTFFLKIAAWLFICGGIATVVTLRVMGVDLTEGQLLIQYAPLLLMAIGMVVGGYGILNNTRGT
jgi:hypothetical protein